MSIYYSFKDIFEDDYFLQTDLNIDESISLKDNINNLIMNELSVSSKNIKNVVSYLSKKIISFKYDESENIIVNYFRKISHLIKEFSRDKLKFSQKDKTLYLTLINAISIYFFHYNNQNIVLNDKHKKIINEFSDFFKLFIKLCDTENNIDLDVLNYEIEFFILIINFFPHLTRSIESKIVKYLNNQFTFLIKNYNQNNREYKILLKNYCLCYYITNFTQSDFNQKYSFFLNKIEETLKFLKQIFTPVKIHSDVIETSKFEEKNLLFDKKSLESITGLYNAKTAYNIILKIYKYSLCNYPKNILFEINLQNQLNLICKLIITLVSFFDFCDDFFSKELILKGLNYKEVNHLKVFLLNKSLRLLSLIIDHYSSIMNNYLPIIKKNINLALKYKEKLMIYIELHDSFLDLIYNLIIKFGSKMYSILEEALYNLVLPNTLDTFITYIELNDITVMKSKKRNFKLIKRYKDKSNLNMLENSRNDFYNLAIEKYSKADLEQIIKKYLSILIAYFYSNNALFIDVEKISKIENLIGNLLYPPYAKLLYNLNNEFKESIFKLLIAFIGKITKIKLVILPETLEMILIFIENNYRFEKDLIVLDNTNKIYLLLNEYVPYMNFTNQYCSSDIENIYTSLTKFKISFSKKINDKLEFNLTQQKEEIFINEKKYIIFNEQNQKEENFEISKNFGLEEISSSLISPKKLDSFKTNLENDKTFLSTFKETEKELIISHDAEKEKITDNENIVDLQMREISSDEESISIPDIN